jgi:hypothetical protein
VFFFLIHKPFFAKELTIHQQLASKPWIPCSFTNSKASGWHILLDTEHLNCHFSHIHKAFLLFRDISLSCHDNPSNHHCCAELTLYSFSGFLNYFK